MNFSLSFYSYVLYSDSNSKCKDLGLKEGERVGYCIEELHYLKLILMLPIVMILLSLSLSLSLSLQPDRVHYHSKARKQ